MKPPAPVPTTKKKKWSKWLKFSGAALLLFAFGMQTRQNTQSALASERMQAAELQSRTKQKAIGYENLYFSAKATGLEQPEYLALAAHQYFIGSSAMIVSAPGEKGRIQDSVHRLQNAAAAVHDLSSLREYIALDNQLETRDQQVEIQGLIEPESNAKFLGQLYLALYVIGSVVALGGQALD